MDKYTHVEEGAFKRMDADLEFETVAYYTYTESYDPSTGETTVTRNSAGTYQCEVLQPSNSATMRELWGTDSNIDVGIRIDDSVGFLSDLEVYGDASQQASEAEVGDHTYVLQDKIPEPISGFVLMPATEK